MCPTSRGDVLDITGNVSRIKGDVSDIKGDVLDIKGDVSKMVCVKLENYTALFWNNRLIIGCENHSMTWWKKNHEQFSNRKEYAQFKKVILPMIGGK
jgi:hypothetical protein